MYSKHITTVMMILGCILSMTVDAANYSGTLPVMYINTENKVPITSKEVYVPATYYLDPMGVEGVEALGSAVEQLPLEIRGRGNYTWRDFDKKPYRIKFASKTSILGMNKSKHFALMANADDDLSGLRNAVGYELARLIGMPWTPSAVPVEVVLNGDYIGLYFLTETIRVDADRVNIVEQADEETDALGITGGWLVEIDNYDSDPHIQITEGNGSRIIFTYKTPEILSSQQEDFLRSQMESIDDAIYASDKSSTEWEDFIDIDALVRFYIVQEILDNAESFHGSCYMYRDMGIGQKWMFGPVWDFGNSFRRGYDKFIYENSPFGQTWIGEIAKFPRFQEHLVSVWKLFRETNFDDIYTFIDNYISTYEKAIQADDVRWPDYGSQNVVKDGVSFKNNMKQKIEFLVKHWGDAEKEIVPSETTYTVYFTSEGTDWNPAYAYSWDSSGTEFLGRWPGTLMDTTSINGITYYTITYDTGFEPYEPMIIFSDGESGVGEHQTENLVLENHAIYNHKGKIGSHTAVNKVTELPYNMRVVGHTIYADAPLFLYNMQGVLLVRQWGSVTVPAGGVYIVVCGDTVQKIIIK